MKRLDNSAAADIENIRRNLKKAKSYLEENKDSMLLDIVLHSDTLAEQVEIKLKSYLDESSG